MDISKPPLNSKVAFHPLGADFSLQMPTPALHHQQGEDIGSASDKDFVGQFHMGLSEVRR